jgi:hypothetical protein
VSTVTSTTDGSGGALQRRRRWAFVAVVLAAAWLGAVGVGFRVLARYSLTPGAPAQAPDAIVAPEDVLGSGVPLDPARPTVLLFVHPLCPCTRATLGELERLVARVDGRMRAVVLFRADDGVEIDWSGNDLWNQATALAGVEVLRDTDGRLAQRFGVRTSGQALVYAPDGRLLFAGGITASRGHAGDNAGVDAILALLSQPAPDVPSTPVFGCPLTGPRRETRCEPR